MTRSKWKGPYINLKYLNISKPENKKKSVAIISRDSSIIPKFIGQTFRVHTGKSFLEIIVSKEMIGHKFGEFVSTRKLFSFKKRRKKITKIWVKK